MAYHLDQVHIDADIASRLIRDQFPEWRDAPIVAVPSDGTVNAIFRIGDAAAARFPLRSADPDGVAAWLEREGAAQAEFATASPVPSPRPLAIGAPGEGFPMPWAIQSWLPGTVATPTGSADSTTLAEQLADLILTVRGVDTNGRRFSGSGRGGDLRTHDAWMQECFDNSADLFDVPKATRLWERFRELPRMAPDAMCHGDLIPPNLLVDGDRMIGVLDTGGFGPADPALDLTCAWSLFDAPGRGILRSRIGSDDLEWQRGAAWSFQQAVGLVWYYEGTNPGMHNLGRVTLGRILDAQDLWEPSS